MTKQKPIRTFNVCDQDKNTYEVKVFANIIAPLGIGDPEPEPYPLEIMYIDDDIIVEEKDELEATINGVNTILYPC